MENLWIVMIPTFFICVGGVGIIVHEIVRKGNFYILKSVVVACMIIASFMIDIPYMQDLVGRKTTVITAEYVGFESANTMPGTREVFFNVKSRQYQLIVPTFTRDVAKLEPGKTYEIEYFNNSKVIKSYKLIE